MIRPGTLDDAPKAAAMRQRAWPESIITPEGMRHALESTPARGDLALFACEESGEILGWAAAGRAWWEATPDAGTVQLSVEPARRGEGIGTALAEAADAHLRRLGVRRTRAMSLDEPGARALAARRGFTELTAVVVSSVDPRTIEPLPVPSGVELVPFAGIDDARSIYDLDLELTQDIPHEEYDAVDFDEWLREYWRSPLVDDDASLVAYVDGELAGITMIRVDRPSGRAANNLAGVRRKFRRRGLALLLKSHSLHRAAAFGASIAITDNDESNAPMLALNTKLGYRPLARRLEWERSSATSSP